MFLPRSATKQANLTTRNARSWSDPDFEMPLVIAAIVVVWIVIFGAAYLSRAVGGLSRRSSVAIVTCSYFALGDTIVDTGGEFSRQVRPPASVRRSVNGASWL